MRLYFSVAKKTDPSPTAQDDSEEQIRNIATILAEFLNELPNQKIALE